MIFSYCCDIGSNVSFAFLILFIWIIYLLFLMNLAKDLIILFIFSNNIISLNWFCFNFRKGEVSILLMSFWALLLPLFWGFGALFILPFAIHVYSKLSCLFQFFFSLREASVTINFPLELLLLNPIDFGKLVFLLASKYFLIPFLISSLTHWFLVACWLVSICLCLSHIPLL